MTTTIDATEDDIRAVAEVLKFAAILDDRAAAPDEHRLAAWAEQIHRHQLGRADLLDGLQKFYDNPSDRAIQIGDLIQHARAIRRDRNERESSAELDQRAQSRDPQAVEVLSLAAGAIVMGPTGATSDRLELAEVELQRCHGKTESMAAIGEYFAAKAIAHKGVSGRRK